MVIMGEIASYILAPSSIILRQDVLYPIVVMIAARLRLSRPTAILLHIIRSIMVAVNIAEICLSIVILILTFLVGLKVGNEVFAVLIENSNSRPAQSQVTLYLIKIYHLLQITIKNVAPFQEVGTLTLLGFGMMLSTFANYVTLRCYDLFPLPVYLFYPFISIIVGIVFYLVLPLTHSVTDDSVRLLRSFRIGLAAKGNGGCAGKFKGCEARVKKYMRRKIRSIQSLKLYAGIAGSKLFCMNKETKREWYEHGIDCTINLLIARSEGM